MKTAIVIKKSPKFQLNFILIKKGFSPQTIKSKLIYYLVQALSLEFNQIGLVDWQLNVNLASVTWVDRRINDMETCNCKAIIKLWKTMTNDNNLAKLIYGQKSEATGTFSNFFLPEFEAIQVKIKFSPTCTKQKLLETMTTVPSLPKRTAAINSPYLAAPKLLREDTWTIYVGMGVLTEVSIIESFFEFPTELTYKLVAESGKKVPKWIQVDNMNKKLVVFTFSTDYDATYNFQGSWRGGLVASANECDSKPLKIKIVASKNNDYYEKEAKYEAQMFFSTRNVQVRLLF